MNQKMTSFLSLKVFCLYILISLLSACGAKLPITTFELSALPAKPDYSQPKYRAFIPINNDAQSLLPKNYSDPEFNLDSDSNIIGSKTECTARDRKLIEKQLR